MKIVFIICGLYVFFYIAYGIGHWKGWKDCSKFYRGESDARSN